MTADGAQWRQVGTVELGTTAHIRVIEKDGELYALKSSRDVEAGGRALLTEHRVLEHLNRSPMEGYVPQVGDWLPEMNGFLMPYLRYPTAEEKKDPTWILNLARALRTLHSVALPDIAGLEDDRPHVARAVVQRFGDLFETVWAGSSFWDSLDGEDARRLEHLRARYPAYIDLLPDIEAGLANAQPALTHGDLAGDNIMVTLEGQLILTDWGSARIGAAWTDPASLAIYSAWPMWERRRFFAFYLGGDAAPRSGAMHHLEILCRVQRYRCCVQSLLWLNDDGEGLDRIGRAFFERQVEAV